MNERLAAKLSEAMQASSDGYFQLVLLVGPPASGKTTLLREMAEESGLRLVNVGLELSRALLELTPMQRSLRLPELVEQLVGFDNEPVVLDNLEILFDISLRQDPLRLLQGTSRNHRLAAAWSGEFSGGRLTYATAEYPEYRCYDLVDALVVTMGGVSTLDAGNV
jgi:polynucleotide 5'-kinase involved in rRNA processing